MKKLSKLLGAIALAITAGAAGAQTQPALYYIQVDHLNTPRLVADVNGTAVWRWDQQEPFANNAPDENPSGLGAFAFPLRFPGQYFDKETGLQHSYFREYDPAIGRFPQFDPLGLRGGPNGYAYAGNDPTGSVDFKGLMKCRWVGPVLVCQWGPVKPPANPLDPNENAANDPRYNRIECPKPVCHRISVTDEIAYTGSDGKSVTVKRCTYYCPETKRIRYIDVNMLSYFWRCTQVREEDAGWSSDSAGLPSAR